MAKRNQSELSTLIQAQAAIHTEANYKEILDTEINQSVVKKKQSVGIVSPTNGSATLDMTSSDLFIFTQDGNIALTFSNMENGQNAWIYITKLSASYTITFSNGTYLGYENSLIDKSTIFLLVKRIGSAYFVAPFGTNGIELASTTVAGLIELATNTEAQAKSATNRALTPGNLSALGASETFAGLIEIATDEEARNKSLTDRALVASNLAGLGATTALAGLLKIATIAEVQTGTANNLAVTPEGVRTQENWNTATLTSGWSTGGGNIRYFKDNLGNVHVRSNSLRKGTDVTASSEVVWNIPAAYQPDESAAIYVQAVNLALTSTVNHRLTFDGSEMRIYTDSGDYLADYFLSFYIVYRGA